MARVRQLISTLNYSTLVAQNVIPDLEPLIESHYKPVLDMKKRLPMWVYKHVKPQLDKQFPSYFGLFIDYMCRKMIADVIPTKHSTDDEIIPGFWSEKWNSVAKDTAIAVGKMYKSEFTLDDAVFGKSFYAHLGSVAKNMTATFGNMAQSGVEFDAEYIVDQNVMGHPDIVTLNMVIDIKTTINFRRMAQESYLQILSYVSIMRKLGRTVDYVGILLPLQLNLIMVDVKSWDSNSLMDKLLNSVTNLAVKIEDRINFIMNTAIVMQGVGWTFSHGGITIPQAIRKFAEDSGGQVAGQIMFSQMNLHYSMTDEMIAQSFQVILQNNLRIYVHAPYSVNLAHPITAKDSSDTTWVLSGVRKQLILASTLGTRGVVVHVGKHKKIMTEEQAKDKMAESIRLVLDVATEACPFLLETPVGCGTELCWKIEDFMNFYDRFTHDERKRFKVCIDTCHVFAAGHDPHNYVNRWIERHGHESIGLIHFNDSQREFGCRVDRHAIAGTGNIPLTSLAGVSQLGRHYNISMVTE